MPLTSCSRGLGDKAFHRYLAWSETTTDVRHVQHRRDGLLKHIIKVGRRLDARLEQEAKITPLLELLSRDATATPIEPLPALYDRIASEGIDRQYWREDDLLAEYKLAVGLDSASAMPAAITPPTTVRLCPRLLMRPPTGWSCGLLVRLPIRGRKKTLISRRSTVGQGVSNKSFVAYNSKMWTVELTT